MKKMKKRVMPSFLLGMLLMMAAVVASSAGLIAPVAAAPLSATGLYAPSGAGEIQGVVFRDFDADATQDAIEPGIQGVTVTAYDVNGTAVATTTTASDGSYTLSGLTDGNRYRIEVTGYADFLYPAPVGTGNVTTASIATSPATDVNVALLNPADYSQSEPEISDSTFFTGDPMVSGDPANAQALVRYPYTRSGLCTSCGGTEPDPTVIATMGDMGSVWGVAYQRSSRILYAASFLKRHAGLYEDSGGNPKLGMIFKVYLSTNNVIPWVDLESLGVNVGTIPDNTSRGLQGNINPSTDADAYAKIGKVGLGDIDISDDESTLWIMSLNDRTLYSLDIDNPTSVTGYPVPDPGCTGGNYRPFAVKYHDGDVYIGEVCDASTSQSAGDLHAYVYKLDDASGTYQAVFDFALNYTKGLAWPDGPGTCDTISGWYPWIDNYPVACSVATNGQTRYVYPMPMLSDIEFDYDGTMILGFIDRLGHQIGDKNANDLVDPPEDVAAAVVGGDILRAYYNPATHAYQLENNATAGPNTTAGANNGEGPGNGEYYYHDNLAGASHHNETTNGGVAINWQQNQVVVTAMDPHGVDTVSGGTNRFNNTTGAGETGYALYHSRDNGHNNGTFAKANGMGDVELLADPAPMELGNTLWIDMGDTNGNGAANGIFDPGEDVIPNAEVSLICDVGGEGFGDADDVTAVTTTDANGRYYFKDGDASLANFPTAPWNDTLHIIPRHTACRILVDTTQTAFKNALNGSGRATIPNNGGSDAGADLRDSDGANNLADTGKVGVEFVTGGSGQSNHSIDFGFVEEDWGDAPATYKTVASDDGPRHLVDDDLYLGSDVDSDKDGLPSADGTGDDNDYHDDEDGVSAFTPLVPNDEACLTISAVNNTGGDAFLYGWMDFNGDGHFVSSEALDNGTLGDYQFSGGKATVPNGGVSNNRYCFLVPNGSPFNGGKAVLRLRLTTDTLSTTGWRGAADNGEVEDYVLTLARVSNYVWNDSTGSADNLQDASDADLSSVQIRYVWAGGNGVIDTAPTDATAQSDDFLYKRTTNTSGIATIIGFLPGAYQLQIATPPANAAVAVSPEEGSAQDKDSNGIQSGGPGTPVTATLTIPNPISLPTEEDGNHDNPGGVNGFPDEHDDLTVDFGFMEQDWGDLPDSYGTDKTNDSGEGVGPSHGVHTDLLLGTSIDGETDGQPSNNGDGDGSDEDGVSAFSPLVPNAQACLTISAVNSTESDAFLYGWMDFNGDGHFSASEALDNGTIGDHQFSGGKASVPIEGALNERYCFLVPNGSTFNGGKAALRLRLTTDALSTTGWGGWASDGEVEDYVRTVARVSTYVWDDENGATENVQDSSDGDVSGQIVRFVWAGPDNEVDTTPQDATAQNDDMLYQRTSGSTGVTTIIGLTPGNYQLQITDPPSASPESVTPNQGSAPDKDSDGVQPEGPGEPSTVDLTIPDPISLSTNESGNHDDPGALYNYPDAQDELSFDYGFRKNRKVAIGNSVWHDTNGNGVKDAGESGIGNITMSLYRDSDGDGVCEPGSDTFVKSKDTKSNGIYRFKNLTPSTDTDPTTYYCVVADKSDVSAAGYAYSSAGGGQDPDNTGDNNDDGIPSGGYIITKPFAATKNGQADTSDTGDPNAYPDDSSYMTVDFGFLTQADHDGMGTPNAVSIQNMTAHTAGSSAFLIGLAMSLASAALFVWYRRR